MYGEVDAGNRLLFKFRSGTHGLNEELGRHRGREGKSGCVLCGAECESVVQVLWECSAYSIIDSCPSQLQSFAEDLQLAGVEGKMDGKLRSSGKGGTDGKDLPVCTCTCMCVDGSDARVAS